MGIHSNVVFSNLDIPDETAEEDRKIMEEIVRRIFEQFISIERNMEGRQLYGIGRPSIRHVINASKVAWGLLLMEKEKGNTIDETTIDKIVKESCEPVVATLAPTESAGEELKAIEEL